MHLVTCLFSSEMPDTKAEDEVDFLSNTRESSVSEEVATGNITAAPKMKQGPKTQAVSGIQSLQAQNVCRLVCCVWLMVLFFCLDFFHKSVFPLLSCSIMYKCERVVAIELS